MKKIIVLILSLLFFQYTALAEEVKKVYLNEAINAALKNNIDLKATQIDINIARNEIKSANRLQNPSIDAFYFMGGAGYNEPKQLGVSQNIEIAKRKARKELAKSNLALVEKNVDYTEFDLKMDVREAYINLVAAKSILDTFEQQKELQEELLDIAQERVKNRKEQGIDVLQAEIALNQLITQVNTAKVNVNTALSNFNKIINDPNKIIYDTKDKIFSEENNFAEMLTPPPNFDFPDFDEIVQKALQNRFDIQIAKQQIDVAEKNLTVVSRQRIPDIALVGGYAYQVGAHTDSGNFNNGAYAGASLVNIPLFYNYSPEIQNATFKLRQAELKYESAKNKAIKDVSAAYQRFLTAVENLNYYENKIIKNSEELIEISKESYEEGKTEITSLIVMKQSYISIIVGYTYALAEYYNSWTNFLREVNDEDFELPEDI
mgnify:CR=1 FL=1